MTPTLSQGQAEPTDALPPLPAPRWGLNRADEELFTAKQMREYGMAARRPLETCQCEACRPTIHASSCAVHNEPAFPKGPCDCGALAASSAAPTADLRAATLTDEQVEPLFRAIRAMQVEGEKDEWFWFAWGVEMAERAHGINRVPSKHDALNEVAPPVAQQEGSTQ